MFGIDHEKLLNKLMEEVFPNIKDYSKDEIVKYNLAVKYILDMSDFKIALCTAGAIVGAFCFFVISSPIGAAFSATAAIASVINGFKTDKKSIDFYRINNALVIALSEVLKATPEEVQEILNNTKAEDFIDFLEKHKLLKNNKEEA